MPVNHCCQSTAFCTWSTQGLEHGLACSARKPSNNTTLKVLAHCYWWKKKPKQTNKNQQQTNNNNEKKKKKNQSEGLVIALLVSAVRVNETPRSIKKLPFSCFLGQNEDWRTAKSWSEHVVDPMICPAKVLARLEGRSVGVSIRNFSQSRYCTANCLEHSRWNGHGAI